MKEKKVVFPDRKSNLGKNFAKALWSSLIHIASKLELPHEAKVVLQNFLFMIVARWKKEYNFHPIHGTETFIVLLFSIMMYRLYNFAMYPIAKKVMEIVLANVESHFKKLENAKQVEEMLLQQTLLKSSMI